MQPASKQFSWNCPSCGRRGLRDRDGCGCKSRQPSDDSVNEFEGSRLKLLLVILVGVMALGLRTYLTSTVPAPVAVTPVSAAVAEPVVAPVVAAAVTKSTVDARPKQAVRKKRAPKDKDEAPPRKRRRLLGFIPIP
jgi:hypothetical protein